MDGIKEYTVVRKVIAYGRVTVYANNEEEAYEYASTLDDSEFSMDVGWADTELSVYEST